MKNLEKFSVVFLVAGFASFIVAFLLLGLWPALMTDAMPEDGGLPKEIPVEWQSRYATVDAYQKALLMGRDVYVKEACWHCHSQYVRPVGNEAPRYGLVSTAGEYENILNRPQLFGTRRVGPDLSRQAGKRSIDWHIAHFYNPKWTEPESVMPSYRWYFDESQNPPVPNEEGWALIAYIENLGQNVKDVTMSQYDLNEITMPPVGEGQ